ncbi:LPS export ABC transporter periplasmic protein LptC [Adhaeribacter sp. BT258]|uniref:LPS export ABC transporter periplasmic protein LptC n=1 Tax=Adhaeribacter terrigena TaxID=2793070 RepID=A0ABS1BXD3_9BACT|nr:OstA-like protein [Adhaeribacter terrigena]MBK0401762.1 LPS export ABC transporter periplasmic protein LptC [Adhaeribacter terrigena]
MKITKVLLFLFFLTMPGFSVWAQQGQPKPKPEKVELLRADALEGGTFNGRQIRKLLGNVVFKQQDTYMYCDSAYQYADQNAMEAFGNVRITQGDSVTATSNTAYYDGDARRAKLRGNVVLQDPRMTLTTPNLDYDLDRKTAFYNEGGTIIDGTNNLTSQTGDYNTNTKMFHFTQNVVLTSPDYLITTNDLLYHTVTKIAYFNGPTTINGKDGKIYAEKGNYNTLTKVSNFERNAMIETEKYLLGGDKLFYNQNTKYGQADGNVRMTSKADNVVIKGQRAKYWQNTGRAEITGSPVLENIMENDTLYMSADILISEESQDTAKASMIYAYHDVRIFKTDLQGKCDSLTYNQKDSVIYMFTRPILWSGKNQLTAKHMQLFIRDKKLHTMKMFTDAFSVSEDTLRNYNQVKGRDMTAFFKNDAIRRVNVNGNSESIYYALEGDTAVTGMNRAICSDMMIQFMENKLQSISFLDKPVARFIPPHELSPEETRLDGYQWLIAEKPTREMVVGPRLPKKVVVKQPAAPAKTTPAKAPTRKEQRQAKREAKKVQKAANGKKP